MPGPVQPARTTNPYLALISIILGASLLQLANSLFVALLPLRLALAGDTPLLAGLAAGAYGIGFLFGCMRIAKIIQTVGHIRTFAALASSCAILSLVFIIAELPWLWLPLRFGMGFCLAGLFITAEGWMSAATAKEIRGSVISFYLLATKAATIIGQVALALGNINGVMFFALCAGLFSAALIPVALTRQQQPNPPSNRRFNLADLYRLAPAAVVGTVASGMINGAVMNLAPAWGAGQGLAIGLIVLLLAMMQVGSLVLQWPLGWLSDHLDRRFLIIGCTVGVTLLSWLVATLPDAPSTVRLIVLFLLLGGLSMSFYGICIAHAADFAEPDQMIKVSSGLLFAWAMGSTIGPVIAGPWMSWLGPSGLFMFVGLTAAVITLFIAYRRTQRQPVPPQNRPGFVNLPATSPRLAEIDPRRTDQKGPDQRRSDQNGHERGADDI